MNNSVTFPDLSSRPFRLTTERLMIASADVLYRAWTEQFDQWFAAPGSVIMKGEVNTVFFLKLATKLRRKKRRDAIRITVGS